MRSRSGQVPERDVVRDRVWGAGTPTQGRRVMLAVVSLFVLAALPAAKAAPTRASQEPYVATVGPLKIGREEFEARAKAAEQEFMKRPGVQMSAAIRSVLRRQVLETLIRNYLLRLEARRQGLAVSGADVDAVIRKQPFFNKGGRFDEALFLRVKAANSPEYRREVELIKDQIAARRLSDRLDKQYQPAADTLRDAAARSLMNATVEHLTLMDDDFARGRAEPKEKDILTYYDSHAAEFTRPERAQVSVIQIDQPALPEGEASDPSAVQAWSRTMRERADSVLTALAGRGFRRLGGHARWSAPRRRAPQGQFPRLLDRHPSDQCVRVPPALGSVSPPRSRRAPAGSWSGSITCERLDTLRFVRSPRRFARSCAGR